MIKHVGKHNQRRVAIVYKTIPDEEHMALVSYTDSLPSMIHDEAMKCLESAIGQNAKELADALFRTVMADGRNCLDAMHRGGWLKKVPTNQVIVTPTANATVRLDELNDILKKMEAGEEATQKMADIDRNRGIKGVLEEGREVGEPARAPAPLAATVDSVLSDSDIANQRLEQANRMEAEAKSLLAEAKRLKEEAKSLTPAKKTNVRKSTTTKKAAA
jgi:hypothetical protein